MFEFILALILALFPMSGHYHKPFYKHRNDVQIQRVCSARNGAPMTCQNGTVHVDPNDPFGQYGAKKR